VKDDGVVVVDIRSVGRSFALPHGTVPFAEGVKAESQPEIRDTKKLNNTNRDVIIGIL
jgi:hypothetical protein